MLVQIKKPPCQASLPDRRASLLIDWVAVQDNVIVNGTHKIERTEYDIACLCVVTVIIYAHNTLCVSDWVDVEDHTVTSDSMTRCKPR